MPIRIAINGFGRIGRSVFRIGLRRPELDFVAVNDLAGSRILAHLLKYDSSQGILPYSVSSSRDAIVIDGKEVPVLSQGAPEKLPWKDLGVDVVLESTGVFSRREEVFGHIAAGAHKVVISEPGLDPDVTIMPGVNTLQYDRGHHKIVSMGSCTANCLAPIAKTLHDHFGIFKGTMTTVHSYTNNQVLLDNPHKDMRRTRSMSQSIIPTTTSSIEAIGRVIPELVGRLHGIAIRVPTPKVALVDFVASLSKRAGREEVNDILKTEAAGPLKGILHCTDEPLVSTDCEGNPYSSIVDLACTQVVGNMVKIIAWYDNESGFSHRLCDLFPFLLGVKRPQ